MKADDLAAIEAVGFGNVEVLKEVSADSAFAKLAEAKAFADGREADPESLSLGPKRVPELRGTISSITVRAVKRE